MARFSWCEPGSKRRFPGDACGQLMAPAKLPSAYTLSNHASRVMPPSPDSAAYAPRRKTAHDQIHRFLRRIGNVAALNRGKRDFAVKPGFAPAVHTIRAGIIRRS
jgi:hypothetical protein